MPITRTELEREYNTDANLIIRDPGKFEGEPLYAPYFWDAFLEGMADDDDDGDVLTFNITADDVAMWPELVDAYKVCLQEDSQGFVHTEVYRR